VDLAQGGGCLFTLNCSTTPGGYSLQHGGCQFPANSYDAPVYSTRLRAEGLEPMFNWKAADLAATTTKPSLLAEAFARDDLDDLVL
jgi:hypothetical protein